MCECVRSSLLQIPVLEGACVGVVRPKLPPADQPFVVETSFNVDLLSRQFLSKKGTQKLVAEGALRDVRLLSLRGSNALLETITPTNGTKKGGGTDQVVLATVSIGLSLRPIRSNNPAGARREFTLNTSSELSNWKVIDDDETLFVVKVLRGKAQSCALL